MSILEETLAAIVPADRAAMDAAWQRWDSIAKPLRSLGLLEEAVVRIAGMTGTPAVKLGKRAVIAMCADNGVVAQGVTQTGQEVTAIVTENMSTGDTSVCRMAAAAGAEVIPVDIGVARPVAGERIRQCNVRRGTADMTQGPAMTREEAVQAVETGIELVRELKELGSRAKFVMISQVSAKELIAKAYQAGVEFFIQKPINLIEVRQVVGNVIRQMENERALHTIQSVFQSREPQPAAPAGRQEVWRRRIQYILSQLGMAGEKGAGDIMELCLFLLERKQTASQIGVGTLCSQLSDSPKTMEQRVRRAVERGLEALPDHFRQVLVLRELSGLSYQEIGTAMELDLGTVKSRIARARVALRKILLEDGNFFDSPASMEIERHRKE